MFRRFGRESVGVVAALAVLGVMAGWVLWGGVEKGLEQSRVPKGTLRHSTGSPQLVSVQPLPDIAGEICQWTPVSASTSLVAALRRRRGAAAGGVSARPRATPKACPEDPRPVRGLQRGGGGPDPGRGGADGREPVQHFGVRPAGQYASDRKDDGAEADDWGPEHDG